MRFAAGDRWTDETGALRAYSVDQSAIIANGIESRRLDRTDPVAFQFLSVHQLARASRPPDIRCSLDRHQLKHGRADRHGDSDR